MMSEVVYEWNSSLKTLVGACCLTSESRRRAIQGVDMSDQVGPRRLDVELSQTFPLQGIVVVDATTDFAGRLCGRLLVDAGATVIDYSTDGKVTSDEWAAFLNAGKLDPRAIQDHEFRTQDLTELATHAHVLLCTRPEFDHPTLGVRELAARCPGLLLVCMPPFGTGPYEAFLSDDVVLSALSGLADCTPGFPDRQEGAIQPPVQSVAPLAEFGAGLTCAVATMAALFQRLTKSEGPGRIEISQIEAVVSMMVSDWSLAAYAGEAPGRRRKVRTLEPNCYLPCRDGHVVIVATSDQHWQHLVEVMGSPAWAVDERFKTVAGRVENVEDLHALLGKWARTQSGLEFMIRAQSRGLPCTALLELSETVHSEQVRVCGSIEMREGVALPADPIVLNGRRRPRYGTPRQMLISPAATAVPPPTEAPLAGIRVLELTQMVAGPFAGQLLAALGAEVLIVESRRHLVSRMFGPFAAKPEYDASTNFNHVNRGKGSVELNLKTTEGKRLLHDLVRNSDIVIENMSRRAAEDLGLTYEALRGLKSDIIFASISAFGRSGPWGSYVSHHGGITALSGLASVIRDPVGNPRLVGAIMPDVLSGTYLALALLQALTIRVKTGMGMHVELSMLDVLLNAMGGLLAAADQGKRFGPHPVRFLEMLKVGRYVAVDGPNCPKELSESDKSRTPREAMFALQSGNVFAGAVQNMLEVIEDPHLRARSFVQWVDHPVVGNRPVPGVPWTFDGLRPPLGHAPVLGSDTDAALRGLIGLTEIDVSRLRESGVLT
jgi:crotonobetainyl-CoA:carnitine CoA-transferase CaiB-like acyl-CoA transferase